MLLQPWPLMPCALESLCIDVLATEKSGVLIALPTEPWDPGLLGDHAHHFSIARGELI